MNPTIEQIHLASQYLAAAGISFLPKKEDDSHTNLGWDEQNNRLTTHSFGASNFQVGLNIDSTELEWLKEGTAVSKINLNNSTHAEILSWMNEAASAAELDQTYLYRFHYELPYADIKLEDSFQIDQEKSSQYAQQISIAQKALKAFLTENELTSPIRIWPHHFDLGVYAELKESLAISAGLAVPDSLVDGLYYYSSAWKGGKSVSTKTFSGLEIGEWRNDWDGATLPSENSKTADALRFLNATRIQFLKG